ncbi:hypothetical protein GCM10007148_25300 [Parvularcula lutaonensis]|nr:hypothetical protein GCM10007148_25300 [Parvularcula lutaonensis]
MLSALTLPLALIFAATAAATGQAPQASMAVEERTRPTSRTLEEAFSMAATDQVFDTLCHYQTSPVIGTSRRLSTLQMERCAAFGRRTLAEIDVGLSAIVLAQSRRGRGLSLDLRDLFLASAAYVPEDDNCILVPNPNESWQDVNPNLPDRPIRIFGPPTGSGARQIFVDRALAEGARQIDCLAELERRDPAAFERAIMPRRDEAWLDAGQNEDAVAAALRGVRDAVGVLGFPGFERSHGLRALSLEGVVPSRGTIRSSAYPLSHPLFLYADAEALEDPSVQRLVRALSPQGVPGGVKVYTAGARSDQQADGPVIRNGRRVYTTP